jgi:hypothetical protein
MKLNVKQGYVVVSEVSAVDKIGYPVDLLAGEIKIGAPEDMDTLVFFRDYIPFSSELKLLG